MPPAWHATSRTCAELSGTYDGAGTTLVSLLAPETGVPQGEGALEVRIQVDGAGQAGFMTERDGERALLKSSRQWSCDGGVLTGRLPQSSLRLWRSDDALVVEETTEAIEHHLRRSHPVRRAIARVYLRFERVTGASTPS